MANPIAEKKSQIDRFQEAARKLGCDEDEATFDAKLTTIAKQQPKDIKDGRKSDA